MKIPRHIAIILDGNRRYAKKRRLQPWKGHEAGADNVKKLADWAIELGVKELTLYTFSTENFDRTKREKAFLFNLFRKKFRELKDSRDDIELGVFGNFSRFPKDVQKTLNRIAKKGKKKKKLVINFAMGYGGRAEIVNAVQELVKKKISSRKINENMIKNYLYLKNDPEIVIRPGGEVRTSNFLMWQSAYSEWFFTNKLWPEFTKKDLVKVIAEYNSRERRFGK
ncbi:di-trans,poly-cis-decaprenylcistransferase [Candidatus Woesearchaeota archaeon]|nr:di-trans,poly-cis-decaprenylcistransferase [Candidatus Woesearchaeota archaeon]